MTIIDTTYNEIKSVREFLESNKQPSLHTDASKHFTKTLILSSASFFEHEITNILIEYAQKKTNNNIALITFLKRKAIDRQYHTYFNWGESSNADNPGKNVNLFCSLFGDAFKKQAEEEIKGQEELKRATKAFLEIGHLRNILVHSNFAAYDISDKTIEDVYSLYQEGCKFIDYLKSKFNSLE